MDFHGGSVTGATAEKLSEIPRFHKRYCKGLMTMETALEMETWNHEDQHVFNTNGRLNEYYTTYKEAEIRDLTCGLAEATKVKKNIARLRMMRKPLEEGSDLAILLWWMAHILNLIIRL